MADSEKTLLQNNEMTQIDFNASRHMAARNGRIESEKTIINDGQPTAHHSVANPALSTSAAEAAPATSAGSVWKKVLIGGVVGISAGVAATFYANAKNPGNLEVDLTKGGEGESEAEDGDFIVASDDVIVDDEAVEEAGSLDMGPASMGPAAAQSVEASDYAYQPVTTIDHIGYATNVRDDMSFSEAFQAARAEVGTGGVFEWHGHLFNTYYQEEWAELSPDYQHLFSNELAYEVAQGYHDTGITDHMIINHDYAQVDPYFEEVMDPEVYDQSEAGSDVQVLGVVQDFVNEVDYVGVNVDGQDIVFIDINQDNQIELVVSDADGDGEISADEVLNVEELGMSTEDVIAMGSQSTPEILNTELDYSNDNGDFI